MALTTAQGSAAYLNRAFNDANATPTVFATNVADLTADEIAAANKFDVGVETLTDAALSKQVLTNMGILPTTNTKVAALEAALTDYFGTAGKGNRGFVVLQLSRILADKVGDADYGTAATAWNTEVAASLADSTNQTLALTTSLKDTLTGGQGADIFSGVYNLLSSSTLNVGDKIVGGAGNDTLTLTVGAAFPGFTTGSVSGVEAISLANTGGSSTTFDSTGITGATSYSLDTKIASITSLTNLPTGVATISLDGQTDATTFTTAFAAGAAEIAGTTNAVAFNITNVGKVDAVLGTLETVAVDLGSFETVNVTSTGDNSISFASAPKAITISGAGTTEVTSVANGLTSFDASAATGKVTATLTGVTTAASLKTVKGGSGVNTFTLDEADLSANATITAGAATTDKVTLLSDGGAVEYTMTGVETLALSTNSTANLLFSGASTTGLKTITSTTTLQKQVDFVNMGANDLTFTSTAGTHENGDINSDHTGATTVNFNGASSNSGKTASTPAADYSFTDAAGALTVNVNAYVNNTSANVTAAKASSVTVNVTGSLDDTGQTQRTVFGDTITADTASSFAVTSTAGGFITGATLSGTKATSANIVNSTSTGSITLTTPALTKLDLTSGAALTVTGSSVAKVEALTVAANSGTTTFTAALPKLSSATLSGTGTTSKASLGNLGGDNAVDLVVSATGLKGGIAIGTLNTGAGYDVTVNMASTGGTSGASTITSIGQTTVGDDVTVNASSVAGNLTIGDISGTGNVKVDASNTAGVVSLSTLTGKTVDVNLTGTAATSSVGDVTAKTSATVALNVLTANTNTINASTDSTDLAVKLTGGILADAITIKGSANQSTITVTGGLGASTDSLTIDAVYSSAQTIDISALTSYDASTISTRAGADIIVGGSGVDTIFAGVGQDKMTGAAGADVFLFSSGDSTYAAPDEITDLGKTDVIKFNNYDITIGSGVGGGTAVTGSSSVATVTAAGVATFALTTTATYKDTLYEVAGLVDAALTKAGNSAIFDFGGTTYLYIQAADNATGAADVSTSDVLVKLTGVVIPTVTLAAPSSGTGLSGFGA